MGSPLFGWMMGAVGADGARARRARRRFDEPAHQSAVCEKLAALMTEGRFRRAYLGIAGGPRPLPPRLAQKLGRTAGVEVVEVVEGGPADRAGLRPEDLIVELDGTPIEGMDELQRVVVSELIGRAVRAKVVREGRERELELVPAELDA